MGVLVAGLRQLELPPEGLVETVVPAAVAAADMGTKAQTEVAMVIMEGLLPALHLLVLVRALLLANLAKPPASCMPVAVAAVVDIFPVEQEVPAVGEPAVGEPAHRLRKARLLLVELITLEAAVAEILLMPTALLADPGLSASACIRRARKRGKDNYAVIQEKNEDGGVHSAVQQGAP